MTAGNECLVAGWNPCGVCKIDGGEVAFNTCDNVRWIDDPKDVGTAFTSSAIAMLAVYLATLQSYIAQNVHWESDTWATQSDMTKSGSGTLAIASLRFVNTLTVTRKFTGDCPTFAGLNRRALSTDAVCIFALSTCVTSKETVVFCNFANSAKMKENRSLLSQIPTNGPTIKKRTNHGLSGVPSAMLMMIDVFQRQANEDTCA